MPSPFEDPTKTDMRGRCEIAIDQSGHEIVTNPVKVVLRPDCEIRGGLRGDLQSTDGEGIRYCYYLRPGAADALPKWLANLAAETHRIGGTKLYVVAYEVSVAFERSCKAAGAGLLLLTNEDAFEHRLDFDTTLPEVLETEFKANIDRLRREMESKLKLNQERLVARFNEIGDLTREMPEEVVDKYEGSVEREYRIWTSWSEGISAGLDIAFATRSSADLEAIARLIDDGPEFDLEDDGG